MNSDLVVGWTVTPSWRLGCACLKVLLCVSTICLYIYKIACLQINDHCRPHRHTGRGSQHHNGLVQHDAWNSIHEKMRS